MVISKGVSNHLFFFQTPECPGIISYLKTILSIRNLVVWRLDSIP